LNEGFSIARSLLRKSDAHISKGDVVQLSEKLYKVAEGRVKLLAKHLRLSEVKVAEEKRRWIVTLLERVVEGLTKKLGADVRVEWDAANYLYVWGFHEAKIEVEGVKVKRPIIEKLAKLTEEALEELKERYLTA